MVIRVQDALAARRNAAGDREKGFTLIELLVVVLIIGVLAAIAIPIYLGQQESARDNAAKAQITNAKTALVAELVRTPAWVVPTGAAAITAASIPGFTPSTEIPVSIIEYTAATATTNGELCIQGRHTGGSTTWHITQAGAAETGECP